MNGRLAMPAACAFVLAACAVGDPRYPPAWEPLPAPASSSCRAFEASYSDRGEAGGQAGEASLTREIFGPDSAWKRARRVDFDFHADDILEVIVWGDRGRLLSQAYSASAGEFACDAGRVRIRGKRWIAEDMIMGREDFDIQFSLAGKYLVARANVKTYGTMFLIVPVGADATHWYRFLRLAQ